MQRQDADRRRRSGGAPGPFALSAGPLTDEAYWSSGWSLAKPHDYEGPVYDFAPLFVLSVPNLRGVHGVLFPLFAPADWVGHNPRTGSPHALRTIVRRLRPRERILYCGYWETFRLYYPAPRLLATGARAVGKALRLVRLGRVGNRWTSPHGYLMARVP